MTPRLVYLSAGNYRVEGADGTLGWVVKGPAGWQATARQGGLAIGYYPTKAAACAAVVEVSK